MMIPDNIWKTAAVENHLFLSSIIKTILSALERHKMSHLLQAMLWILSFRWVREGIARSDWLLVKAKQSSAPHARSPCQRAEEEEEEEESAEEEEGGGAGNCQRRDENSSPPRSRTAWNIFCWLKRSF